MTEKVVQLMSVDLLRQQQRWKDGLAELRDICAQLQSTTALIMLYSLFIFEQAKAIHLIP